MRYKFRAWEKEDKVMVPWERIMEYRYNERWFIDHTEENYINCIFTDDDIVLMQFTGLVDKNGKEIYEGDVVQACFVWGCIGRVVTYYDWLAAFGVEVSNGRYLFSEHNPNIWEVLGNVYENPELIEGEDEE